MSLVVLPDWCLGVAFLDGTSGTVDMREVVFAAESDGTALEALREPDRFAEAEIVLGAVEWPNGTNLAPDAMHDEIRRHGRWVLSGKPHSHSRNA